MQRSLNGDLIAELNDENPSNQFKSTERIEKHIETNYDLEP